MSVLTLSTSNVTQEVKVRMGREGHSAIPATTVMQNWDTIVKKHGGKPALYQKVIQPVRNTQRGSIHMRLMRGVCTVGCR
jgi:hypothetical protein